MPANSISTTITMASLGDIPRMSKSSKMLCSSSDALLEALRLLIASNVLLIYLTVVLVSMVKLRKIFNYFTFQLDFKVIVLDEKILRIKQLT